MPQQHMHANFQRNSHASSALVMNNTFILTAFLHVLSYMEADHNLIYSTAVCM